MFKSLKKCPLCGSEDQFDKVRLNLDDYVFGSVVICLPDQGISLIKCNVCHLLYKDKVPTQEFLASLFDQHAEK